MKSAISALVLHCKFGNKQYLFSALRLKYSTLLLFTTLIITLSSGAQAVCVDSGEDGAFDTGEVAFGITTADPTDGTETHTLDSLTIGGTTYTDFINPTGYNFQFTAPPPGRDDTLIYRMLQGTPTTDFDTTGAAGWPAAILDTYQSRNLNLYQAYDTDVNAGDFWEVTYASPVSSTAGLFVAWTERFGNNGVTLEARDASNVLLGSVVVTPGAGGVFGAPVTYIDTGVDVDSLSVVDPTQSLGIAVFPIDDLAPVGSQVASIRVLPVAGSDAGDGKVFIFGDEDVRSCGASIELW